MLDPAIVSGQLANNLDHQAPVNHLGRPDSPAPNWITANLEQLTEPGAAYSSQNNLIPAFNGLGLGDRLGGRQGRGGWGGVASTATPPPGFSHHRQNLGQHYQGFPGINKGSEAHKIGGSNHTLTIEKLLKSNGLFHFRILTATRKLSS